MVAKQTANGTFKYSSEFFGSSLDTWVQEVHKYNCNENGWFYNPLKPGCFGYDNLCLSLGYTFDKLNDNPYLVNDLDKLCEFIHTGWAINYIYWRDNKPWLKSHAGDYKKSSKPLGDSRRNLCSEQEFHQLDEEEKEKDRIIARYLQQQLVVDN
jgi:hypothetical protein